MHTRQVDGSITHAIPETKLVHLADSELIVVHIILLGLAASVPAIWV